MPIFSLPSPYGIGTFGRAAYEFIDQLKRGRQTYWQVLPMGPTCYGDSRTSPTLHLREIRILLIWIR